MRKVFLLLLILTITGCATSVRYSSYTSQKFPPKPRDYFVTLYPQTQQHPVISRSYVVIGKVSISGKVSNGVTSETLSSQAKAVARKKGADAIINVKTENLNYSGIYTVPGHVDYHPIVFGRHRGAIYMEDYYPPERIPYSDTVLTFQGELIVFNQ